MVISLSFSLECGSTAIGSSQVFAGAKRDAQDVDGTLYKTRVGSDTPRDVVFPNDHIGSILALNGTTH